MMIASIVVQRQCCRQDVNKEGEGERERGVERAVLQLYTHTEKVHNLMNLRGTEFVKPG